MKREKPDNDLVAAPEQHSFIGVESNQSPVVSGFERTGHPNAQWFSEAALGLFVHWGISAVHGGGDLSWMMMANCGSNKGKDSIAPNEYYSLADRFNPDRYHPENWLKTAAETGFTYAVLTTKHHDGYNLWPSAYGEMGTRSKMGGRDLVRPFVNACRKFGLKVGFYYSPPDWYYNRGYMSFNYLSKGDSSQPAFDMDHRPVSLPEKPEGWDKTYRNYIRAQVEELLTQYGKIDMIWFDGGPDSIPISRIRELQPGIVINPRMHGYGDFQSVEGEMCKSRPEGWWEFCSPWSIGGWGYNKREVYRPMTWMLDNLARARAWNGNFLVNVSPRPNGELPESCYERLRQLRDWLKINSEAVFGIDNADYTEFSNVPVTSRGKIRYLHVLVNTEFPVEFRTERPPQSVTILGQTEKLQYSHADGIMSLTLEGARKSEFMDIIKVELQS